MFINYTQTYIIFENRTNLFAMEKVLLAHELNFEIKPAPRALCKTCVAAILIDNNILEKIEDILYAYPSITIKETINVEKKKLKFLIK
ncbi:MAG: putative Se/S carrier-like protein [Acidaminobacteraceae bacterium]